MTRTNKFILLGLVGISLLALMIWVYKTYNPLESHWFPQCPSKLLLALDCPGCGSQRAVHQLLNGHLLSALTYNPLFVIYLPYVALGFLIRFFSTERLLIQKVYRLLYGRWASIISLIAIITFTIVRNTSWWQTWIIHFR